MVVLIINMLNAQERESGQRLNIIIVSEGAIDREGNPITAEMIREVYFFSVLVSSLCSS